MATAYAFLAVDMDNLYFDGGYVTTATSIKIQITNGVYLENYYGSFTYSNDELAGGVVKSYDISKYGSKLASIKGLNHSALKWDSYETVSGLHAFIFSGNDTLNGSSYNDVLRSYAGDDAIYGNAGRDILYGGAGNDTIDGGGGIDTMSGGSGNDIYFVNYTSEQIVESGGTSGGIDIVNSSVTWILPESVEKLILTGTAAISGTGNALANTMTGNSGANILSGLGGNDTLIGGAGNDILDGGTGVDSMTGGLGNDTYVVNAAGDKTIENSGTGTGIDTVQSSITWTLGANVEKLMLTGTAAINGTGNTLANTLTGNSGANILSGGSGADKLVGNGGADILNGGSGSDTLTGGAGHDVFLFKTTLGGSNVDSISDFTTSDETIYDTIQLSKTTFTQLTISSSLNLGRFRSSTDGSAADTNDYILYNTTTGALFYDADGSGKGVAVQFATLSNKPQKVTAADFEVVA